MYSTLAVTADLKTACMGCPACAIGGGGVQPTVFVLGDAMVDMVVSVCELPKRGGDTEIRYCHKLPGGSAANVAVGLARLGVRTAFLGKIGDDREGAFLLEEFRKELVDISGVSLAQGMPTGLVISLVDEVGERTMLSFRGAGTELRHDDIDVAKVLNGKIIHVSGYCFLKEPQLSTSLTLLRVCKEKGVKVALDPGPQMSKIPLRVLEEVLQLTTIFLPNAQEALELTGRTMPEEAVRAILRLGPELVCVKLGAIGCVIGDLRGCLRVPGFEVRVVDTTGAGDAFDAGFLYGFLQSWRLEKIGTFANAVGALSVTQAGARTSLPRLDEVELFLKEMGLRDEAV